MKRKLIWIGILTAFVVAGFQLSAVSGQDSTPITDDQVNEVANQLYCPVCENTPLDVCPTTACAQWRDLIREKLSQGWSAEQIKQYFVDQYGDRVLAEPPRRGLNWLVYILPPIIILAAAILLFQAIRRMRQSSKPVTKPITPDSGDEYLAQIENELRNRKE